jgi:hypothetical protein
MVYPFFLVTLIPSYYNMNIKYLDIKYHTHMIFDTNVNTNQRPYILYQHYILHLLF